MSPGIKYYAFEKNLKYTMVKIIKQLFSSTFFIEKLFLPSYSLKNNKAPSASQCLNTEILILRHVFLISTMSNTNSKDLCGAYVAGFVLSTV